MKNSGKNSGTGFFRFHFYIAMLLFIFAFFVYRAFELVFQSPLPAGLLSPASPVRRGIIFDSQNHELAVSRDTASVGVRPFEVINPAHTASLLARHLKMSKAEVLSRITDQEKKFSFLKRKVPTDDAELLKELKLPGITFNEDRDRYYPNHKLASSVLGFTGLDGEGLSGIEFQYNHILLKAGKDEFVGHNVHLTLNSFVQHQLEKTLNQALESSESKSAVGIIMEVSTGRILAMASLPDFDPNDPRKFSESSYKNRAISDSYEPGSTFKMFTLSALIREGLAEEERNYPCKGFFEYKGRKVRCTAKHGNQTLRDVLKSSCNTGMIDASWRMPVLRYYENLKNFGFGNSTEIPLPGEARGYLPAPKDWDIYLKMTIPIGHGLSVTPLQLVTAAAAIGNGGQFVQPMLVDKITNTEGKVIEKFIPHTRQRVISGEASRKVLDYLRDAVESGTGTLADIKSADFNVCGKTGTSIKSDKTGYKEKRYQASFAGFFPCEKPEIAIMIMLDEPTGGAYHGGRIAAPVFRDVLKEIIPVIHTGEKTTVKNLEQLKFDKASFEPGIMPNLIGKSKKETMRILWKHFPGEHNVSGAGYLLESNPKPGSKITAPYKFTLRFGFIG